MTESQADTTRLQPVTSRVVIGAVFVFMLGVVAGWALHTAIVPGAGTAGAAGGTDPIDGQIAALQKQIAEAESGLGSQADPAAARVQLANGYYDLGTALASRGDSNGALEAWRKAVVHYQATRAAGRASPDVLTDLGTMLFRIGQPDEAVRAYADALAADSAHLNAWMNLGVVRKEAFRDSAGARQAWERVLAISPAGPEAARVKGWIGKLGQKR